MMSKKLKLYELAYDNLYNLNSNENYKFEHILRTLEKEVEGFGYEFYLKSSSQKFKLRVIK